MRRTPTRALAALALLAVLAGVSVVTGEDGVDRSDVVVGGAEAPDALGPRAPEAAARAARSGRDDAGGTGEDGDGAGDEAGPLPVFARYEDVTLRLPTTASLGVRFTEGRRVGAVPLEPRGRLTANANPQGFDADDADHDPDGPDFAVAAPAGRGRPAASAAIVSMPPGAWVRAPVSGEVTDVAKYPTGDGTDWRLVLEPAARPELHVTVTGLHRPRVGEGDAVRAGEVLAAPRLVGDDLAEVGLEMGPASAPTTLDLDEQSGP